MKTRTARLRLDYAPPYDWAAQLAFLAARTVPGVERVDGGAYARTFAVDSACGALTVRHAADACSLDVSLAWRGGLDPEVLEPRLRRLFDLDADAGRIDAALAADPDMAPLVAARPGLRRPGAFSLFEIGVRAILGQQISVQGARTLAGRLTAMVGRPVGGSGATGLLLCFPEPEAVAAVETQTIGLTRSRAASLQAFAVHAATGGLDPALSPQAMTAGLLTLPGIGPWTTDYIGMRGLGQDDIFPAGDLGLARALAAGGVRPGRAELLSRSEAWRPYRTYAAFRLWLQADPPARPGRTRELPDRSESES